MSDIDAPSYQDLYVTTKNIPRTRIFDLPYGYEVTCNRVGGWCLWLKGTQIAGEYGTGLRLDVNGHVIVDSLSKKGKRWSYPKISKT
jgi:hypothetical protein